MSRIQVFAVCGILALVGFVFYSIRTGRLKEKYALLWLLGCGMLLSLCLWRALLERVSALVGVYYPPSLLFLAAFFVITAMLLHFSIAISCLEQKIKLLTQRLVLLEAEGQKT